MSGQGLDESRDQTTLAVPLAVIGESRLADIPLGLAARVVRRIVEEEAINARLEVAAFNSAH